MEANPSFGQLMRIRSLPEGGRAGQGGHARTLYLGRRFPSPSLSTGNFNTDRSLPATNPTPIIRNLQKQCVHGKDAVLYILTHNLSVE